MIQFDLNEIKESLPPSFQLFLSSDLTSKTPNHRQLIREELLSKLSELSTAPDQKSILNLDQLPKDEHRNISISHCHNSSGFALVDKNFLVGFDLESSERITDKVIHRIAKPDEIAQTPEPKGLLSAKEACWKSINGSIDVSTISQIETYQWLKDPSNWFRFKATISGQSLDGQGFLAQQSGIYISFFLAPSTFV